MWQGLLKRIMRKVVKAVLEILVEEIRNVEDIATIVKKIAKRP